MEAIAKTITHQNMTRQVQPFSREWMVSFKDPRQLWTENWFALVLEVVSALVVLQVFRNAKRKDPKSAYLLVTAVFATVTFELLPFIPRAGYQLWWYHQGMVNILKHRVPSYTVTIYALVHYMAHGLTSKSNLPPLTRSVVTAICGSLILFPCLWFAPRLLLIFLHFDDPVFRDQIAGVPYIQLVVVLLMLFHTSHLSHQNYSSVEVQERNTFSYIKCSVQAGIASGIYSLVEQYLLYILLCLIMHVHTGLCLVAGILILLYLAKDELKEMQLTSISFQGYFSPLIRKQFWAVLAALIFISSLPLWLNVYNLKSSSDKLELGPCHIYHGVSNTSPLDVPRRRYVCPEDATHLNFDFHCLTTEEITNGVKNKTTHYTVCGKNFENSFQVFTTFTVYSTICLVIFYAVMIFSFSFKVQEKITECSKKVD